jgi:chromosome segregation ATPase
MSGFSTKPDAPLTKEQIEAGRGEDLKKYHARVNELSKEIIEKHKELDVVNQKIGAAKLAHTEALSSQAKEQAQQREASDAVLAKLKQQTAEEEQKHAALKDALVTIQHELDARRLALDEQEAKLMQKDAAISARDTACTERETSDAARTTMLDNREHSLNALDARLKTARADIEKLKAEVSQIQASNVEKETALKVQAEAIEQSRKVAEAAQAEADRRTQVATVTEQERVALASAQAAIDKVKDDQKAYADQLEQKELELRAVETSQHKKDAELKKRETVVKELETNIKGGKHV